MTVVSFGQNWCIGFPHCRERVTEDQYACKRCWTRLPKHLRNELMAIKRRFPDTKLYQDTLARVEKILHDRLRSIRNYHEKRDQLKKMFTIVG